MVGSTLLPTAFFLGYRFQINEKASQMQKRIQRISFLAVLLLSILVLANPTETLAVTGKPQWPENSVRITTENANGPDATVLTISTMCGGAAYKVSDPSKATLMRINETAVFVTFKASTTETLTIRLPETDDYEATTIIRKFKGYAYTGLYKKTYLYKRGVKQTGIQKVGSDYYYFSPSTGKKQTKGSWITWKGCRYRIRADGTGRCLRQYTYKVGNYYYKFNSNASVKKVTFTYHGVPVKPNTSTGAISLHTIKNIKARYAAVQWAIKIANDNTFKYGNNGVPGNRPCPICHPGAPKRYGCNGFIWSAYAHGAGDSYHLKMCKAGKSYDTGFTPGVRGVMVQHSKTYKLNASNLQTGDYITNGDMFGWQSSKLPFQHAVLYAGNNTIVEAKNPNAGIVVTKFKSKAALQKWLTTDRRSNGRGYDTIIRYIGEGRF